MLTINDCPGQFAPCRQRVSFQQTETALCQVSAGLRQGGLSGLTPEVQDVSGRQEILAGGGRGEPQAVQDDPEQQWGPAAPPEPQSEQSVPHLPAAHTPHSQEQPPLRETILVRRLQGEQAAAEVNSRARPEQSYIVMLLLSGEYYPYSWDTQEGPPPPLQYTRHQGQSGASLRCKV